jgi:hypothetical protein
MPTDTETARITISGLTTVVIVPVLEIIYEAAQPTITPIMPPVNVRKAASMRN